MTENQSPTRYFKSASGEYFWRAIDGKAERFEERWEPIFSEQSAIDSLLADGTIFETDSTGAPLGTGKDGLQVGSPRTDAECNGTVGLDYGMQPVVHIDFARGLERELIESQATIAAMAAAITRVLGDWQDVTALPDSALGSITQGQTRTLASALPPDAGKGMLEELDRLRAGNGFPSWRPDRCPISMRPFQMWMEHPDGSTVPLYGDNHSMWTLAEAVTENDGNVIYVCETFDGDENWWTGDLEDQAVCVVNELMPDDLKDARAESAALRERLEKAMPPRSTDEHVREWMERHDWKHSESDARCAMDDAQSIHLTTAPAQTGRVEGGEG